MPVTTISTCEISLRATARATTPNDQGNPVWSPELSKVLAFTGGTTVNKFDLLFTDTRTVTTGATDAIDLSGALLDALGNAFVVVKMVGLIITSLAANTTVLSIGAGSAPWFGMFGATGDVIKLFPGGIFVDIAPDATGLGAVTPTTADILSIINAAGASATYDIWIMGRTA